jgi:protein phosphatase
MPGIQRNRNRPDRNFGPHVIRQQSQQLRRSLRNLEREGFRRVHVLRTLEEVDAAEMQREPLWNNLKHEHGPFDIIGDVHGCFEELIDLLTQLGYSIEQRTNADGSPSFSVKPPEGRKLVFLGDLVDRGPKIPEVLRLTMSMVQSGAAICVPGNHDIKLMRKLRGKDVLITHGLGDSLKHLDKEPSEFRIQVCEFLDDLVSHYVLDRGMLVVAHAGMKEEMQGRGSGKVREFAL